MRQAIPLPLVARLDPPPSALEVASRLAVPHLGGH